MRSRHHAFGFAVAAAAAFIAGSCTPPPPAPELPQASATARVPGTAPPVSLEDASVAARTPPDAGVTRLVPRASTPGLVQCESVDCPRDRQVCCAGGTSGRCVDRTPDAAASCKEGEQIRECDESSDCPTGERCCRRFSFDSECQSRERWSCVAGSCGTFSDSTAELCLRGSTCASGPCRAREGVVGWPLEGFCPLEGPELACGGTRCKSGEACCWNAATNEGRCTSDGTCGTDAFDPKKPFRLFTCERPSDCGPGFECFNTSGLDSHEEYLCGHTQCHPLTVVLGPVLCEKPADCPKTMLRGDPPKAFGLVGCKRRADHPPGVKACAYR